MLLSRTFAVSLLALAMFSAHAATLRVGNQGDVLSMDPHSLNEAVQLDVLSNVYEPLILRDRDFRLAPALATQWRQTAPTVWRLELRRKVHFHDGSPFTADDVVFSFARAKERGSDLQAYVSEIREVRKIDDHTVELVTARPYPILPETLYRVAIMSRKWCEANQAMQPVDRRKGIENAASFRANGTGPFRLRERQPSVRTTFVRRGAHWAGREGNVDEVIFTPIGNDATRLAALLTGEVDIIDPLSLQDAERVKASRHLKVKQGMEGRVILLGMDQRRDELPNSSIKGRNPFKDRRVRQAIYQAIDVEGIRRTVMRGTGLPTALMVTPEVRGYPADLARRLPYDPDGARRLLAEAGYADGFEVRLNCPNDRYVNDSAICQAVAANLSRIGVKIQLEAESKSTYFPRILRREPAMFLLGWAAATADSHYVLHTLLASPGDGGRGQWNLGGYKNARLDELTAAISSEQDEPRRMAMIHEAMKLHQDDIGHIPLHQQPLSWGMRREVDAVQTPGNGMPWRYVRIDGAPSGGRAATAAR